MKKPIALLLAASLLAGCPGPGPGPGDGGWIPPTAVPPPPGCHDALWGPPNEVYEATFPNGALDTGNFDSFSSPPQAMKPGDAGPAANGTYSIAPAPSGALGLSLQAPDEIPDGQTPSVGVFRTGLNFGLRSIFVARATFQRLDGKMVPPPSDEITNAWAVAVTARTGDQEDLSSETRIGATFRVLDQDNSIAKLSIQDSAPGATPHKIDVDKAIVASIFDKKSPQPFTLELSVNRQTCTVTATLTSGNAKPQTLSSRLTTFLAQSGPPITAIGPALATCCAPKSKLYAEVKNFQIWVPLPGPVSKEPNVPNPPPINPL